MISVHLAIFSKPILFVIDQLKIIKIGYYMQNIVQSNAMALTSNVYMNSTTKYFKGINNNSISPDKNKSQIRIPSPSSRSGQKNVKIQKNNNLSSLILNPSPLNHTIKKEKQQDHVRSGTINTPSPSKNNDISPIQIKALNMAASIFMNSTTKFLKGFVNVESANDATIKQKKISPNSKIISKQISPNKNTNVKNQNYDQSGKKRQKSPEKDAMNMTATNYLNSTTKYVKTQDSKIVYPSKQKIEKILNISHEKRISSKQTKFIDQNAISKPLPNRNRFKTEVSTVQVTQNQRANRSKSNSNASSVGKRLQRKRQKTRELKFLQKREKSQLQNQVANKLEVENAQKLNRKLNQVKSKAEEVSNKPKLQNKVDVIGKPGVKTTSPIQSNKPRQNNIYQNRINEAKSVEPIIISKQQIKSRPFSRQPQSSRQPLITDRPVQDAKNTPVQHTIQKKQSFKQIIPIIPSSQLLIQTPVKPYNRRQPTKSVIQLKQEIANQNKPIVRNKATSPVQISSIKEQKSEEHQNPVSTTSTIKKTQIIAKKQTIAPIKQSPAPNKLIENRNKQSSNGGNLEFERLWNTKVTRVQPIKQATNIQPNIQQNIVLKPSLSPQQKKPTVKQLNPPSRPIQANNTKPTSSTSILYQDTKPYRRNVQSPDNQTTTKQAFEKNNQKNKVVKQQKSQPIITSYSRINPELPPNNVKVNQPTKTKEIYSPKQQTCNQPSKIIPSQQSIPSVKQIIQNPKGNARVTSPQAKQVLSPKKEIATAVAIAPKRNNEKQPLQIVKNQQQRPPAKEVNINRANILMQQCLKMYSNSISKSFVRIKQQSNRSLLHTKQANILLSASTNFVNILKKCLLNASFDQLKKMSLYKVINNREPSNLNSTKQYSANIIFRLIASKYRSNFSQIKFNSWAKNSIRSPQIKSGEIKVNAKQFKSQLSQLFKIIQNYHQGKARSAFNKILFFSIMRPKNTIQAPVQAYKSPPKPLKPPRDYQTEKTNLYNARSIIQSQIVSIENKISNKKRYNDVQKGKLIKKQDELTKKIKVIQADVNTKREKNRAFKITLQQTPSQQDLDISLPQCQSLIDILTEIYSQVFKGHSQIVDVKILIKKYTLIKEDQNPILQQWNSLLVNAKLKIQIAKYQGAQGQSHRRRQTLKQEQGIVTQLLRNYVRERYLWQWVKVTAQKL